MAKKKGLPPSGSTIGKSALTIRNRFFAASSIVEGSLYGRVRSELATALRERPSALISVFSEEPTQGRIRCTESRLFGKVSASVGSFISNRVAGRPCSRPALSELGVKVSLHPAQ